LVNGAGACHGAKLEASVMEAFWKKTRSSPPTATDLSCHCAISQSGHRDLAIDIGEIEASDRMALAEAYALAL